MQTVDNIVDCIVSADPESAIHLLRQWAGQHGTDRLADRLLVPVMDRFTAQYTEPDQSPLARGYVAARVAEAAMEMIARDLPACPLQQHGVVVLGNIEDDFHALGRRIVGTFLRSSGWHVVDLGNDVPAAQFVDAALQHRARVVGVSAMMYATARGIVEVRREIDRRKLGGTIKLAVGGAVFGQDQHLIDEVGGDGTAGTAQHAPALVRRLHDEAVAAGELP